MLPKLRKNTRLLTVIWHYRKPKNWKKLHMHRETPNNAPLRSLELCVGAGGLALGMARAGFQHAAVIDSYTPACESLRLNKQNKVDHVQNWEIIEADITDLTFSEYTGIDVLSGGPPCQPFSHAGMRNGRLDEREMFPEFIRAIRECAPKGFVIENVRGLQARSFLNYFTYIQHQLRFPDVERKKAEKWTEHRARLERLYTGGRYGGIHYKVISQVLNAANFGVAQRRERVFIVGVRADLGIEYSFPLPTHSRESLLTDQWVNEKYWERHGISRKRRPERPVTIVNKLTRLTDTTNLEPWKTVRDVINDLPRIGLGRASRKVPNHFLNPGARAYPGHDGSRMDEPAKTIKAGRNGVPGGENMLRLDDGTIRYFSVRECARLQAFPDDWAFDGSWCSCMRQIGNAVPVTLSQIVATPLAKALKSTPG
jgi:DNA (cytosine-5)-methyltransferase 1